MQDNKNPNFLQKFDCTTSISERSQINKQIKNVLCNGILNKLQAINFYEDLVKLSPTKYEYSQIKEILEDEKKHLHKFNELSTEFTDQEINNESEIEPVIFRTYRDGLLKAYENELLAYTDYQNAYSLVNDKDLQNCFFRVVTDELKHANRFMFLYFRDNL